MTDTRLLEAANRRISELEAELALVKASRSWRVTAPLRALRSRPAREIEPEPPAAGDPLSDRDLVMRFESLGDNCEFGLMQRRVGVERLGLLRYGGARNTGRLIEAIRHGFAGFAIPQDLDMYVLGQEWIAVSLRYGFSFHTGRPVDDVHPAIVREAESTKLLFMADLLRQDLATGHKIFVRRVDEGDNREGMLALYRTIRRIGPSKLLWVIRSTQTRPHATVEHVTGGLFVGYHAGLADYGSADRASDDLWMSLLRAAEAAVRRRTASRPAQ